MSNLTATYRKRPVISYAALLLGSSVYMYFAPPLEYGKMSDILRTEEGLTILGVLILFVLFMFTVVYSIYAARAIVGLPALSNDNRSLRIYVIPFKTVPIHDIDRIIVGSSDVEIYFKDGRTKKVNTRLINDAGPFFEQIERTLV